MAKHREIDYERFLPRLVAGLRKAWQQLSRKRPNEIFYTFGIETDSDITDLNPLCSTVEQAARLLATELASRLFYTNCKVPLVTPS